MHSPRRARARIIGQQIALHLLFCPQKHQSKYVEKKWQMKIFFCFWKKKHAPLGGETTTAIERKGNRFSCERFQNSENRQQNYVR